MPTDLTRTVRRNTVILAAVTAVTSGALQLVAALASTTFVLATGIEGLLGLGPAIFLATAALAALPAGRAMDRFGRVPVIAAGFLVGICGGVVTAVSAGASSGPGVIAGFILIGAATGTVLLSRLAGGDMYPPERRAHGIALVLFGAVFGAILGPAVFGPLFSDIELEPSAFVGPWLAAAGFMALGFVIVLFVRPDPKKIAALVSPPPANAVPVPAAPLREIIGRPGVVPALLAAFASYGVMVSVMNLTGYAVVHEHGHHQQDVFPIIGAHVFGMFALVLVVGNIVDRIGSTPVLVGGLTLEAAACAGLVWAESVAATAALLFGLGLGWNLSFVAATTAMVNRASPSERGRLIGFSDLSSGLLGASLALIGGYALQVLGVVALGAGAAMLALLPALYIARTAVWRRPAADAA
jgi:MFS family permease